MRFLIPFTLWLLPLLGQAALSITTPHTSSFERGGATGPSSDASATPMSPSDPEAELDAFEFSELPAIAGAMARPSLEITEMTIPLQTPEKIYSGTSGIFSLSISNHSASDNPRAFIETAEFLKVPEPCSTLIVGFFATGLLLHRRSISR